MEGYKPISVLEASSSPPRKRKRKQRQQKEQPNKVIPKHVCGLSIPVAPVDACARCGIQDIDETILLCDGVG